MISITDIPLRIFQTLALREFALCPAYEVVPPSNLPLASVTVARGIYIYVLLQQRREQINPEFAALAVLVVREIFGAVIFQLGLLLRIHAGCYVETLRRVTQPERVAPHRMLYRYK